MDLLMQKIQPEKLLLWGPAALIFLVSLAVLMLVRRLLLRMLRRSAANGGSLQQIAAETLRLPSVLWCAAGALAASLNYAELTRRQVHLTEVWIVIFLLVSLTLVASSLAVRLVMQYGERQGMPFAVAGLSRTLTRVFVFSIGAMTVLHYLGISVTPLLTALGVGGLAVALALQDTLANFFAGVHLLIEEPISVGHFIRLTEEEQGTVTDIGWRTTRVLTPRNNIIIVPNTKITSAVLTNFSLPDPRTVADIPILVSPQADVNLVRELALRAAIEHEQVLKDPGPLVLLDPGIMPTHVQLKLVFWIPERLAMGLIRSEVYFTLMEKLRRENVPLPAPDWALRPRA
jgi:small-conductance mechanosensitive channel